MQIIKRSVLFFWLLVWLIQPLMSQEYTFPTKVLKYFPAPGQHINDTKIGIPEKAYELTKDINSGVSLGAFGGYIIFYFEEGIENHSDNPYGVDFTVFGNSFSGSSEPGIVQVMKDENLNGIPDENWFEIAGSLHYSDLITHNYSICYYQPANNEPTDVLWSDNEQNNGAVFYNTFHKQSYYPDQQYFDNYPIDSVVFTANRLLIPVYSEKGILKTGNFLFGYADNIQLNNGVSLNLPDNPYTPEKVEGAGGNAIDISWAVDDDGNYASLDKIHFVKIYSAVLANAGPLGEVSTEVTGIVDVPQNKTLNGQMEVISMESVPDRVISGSERVLHALHFKNGRPFSGNLLWVSDNDQVAEIINDSIFKAKEAGIINLSVSSANNNILSVKEIKVVKPENITIDADFDQLLLNKEYKLTSSVLDDEGYKIDEVFPSVISFDDEAIEIKSVGRGVFVLKGLKAGTSEISFGLTGDPEITYDFKVNVVLVPDPVVISFSMQLDDRSIIERSWFTIEKQNSKAFIERGEDNSDLLSDPDINLSDVITQVLLNNGYSGEGNSFQYRIDEHANEKMYFWQLGTDWEYYYGWGGSTEASFSSVWAASINDSVYFNDFNNLVIHDSDIISLSLIEDISQEWSELILIPEKQSVEPGEEILFSVKKSLFKRLNDHVLINEDNYSIQENEVLINGSSGGKLSQLLTTEDEKKFSLRFDQDGIYKIWIEGFEEYPVNIYSGTTGSPELYKDKEGIIFYPNPCGEKIYVRTNQYMPIPVKLLNMQGRVLMEKVLMGQNEEMDISGFKPGVYLIEFESQNRTSRKIIIKH